MINEFALLIYSTRNNLCCDVPSMTETHKYVDDFIHLLFPLKDNKNLSLRDIQMHLDRMRLKLKELLIPLEKELERSPEEIAADFFTQLPAVYKLLLSDAETFNQSDPAAKRVEEIILCYPGFYCLTVYRLAHILNKMNVPVLPRIMSIFTHYPG